MNDSKKTCASHVDRHEHIGKGHIGLSRFELLMNDSRFFSIVKILETPKDEENKDALEDDLRNLTQLKELMNEETRRHFQGEE